MAQAASLRLLIVAALVLVSSMAFGARIVIDAESDPNSRLDIRTIVLPGGEEVQLYVIEGEGLVITIDEDVLEADHVEFDLTNRLVRVIGLGRFTTGGETVEGYGLIIDLSAESFLADDVLILTDAIDVTGDSASRVPGLIRVALGEFSLCSRCGQVVEDYGFTAARLELYPGDRLVAFDVTVLIRATPVLHLPLMVLPLAQPDRQPRLEYRTGTATERALIAVTWPYVAGPDAYGDIGFRYYADVIPGGSWVGDTLLGGSVERSYLGGSLNHRFYTDRGKGVLAVDYTPAFVVGGAREDHEFTVRFAYADEEVLGPPNLQLSLQRDDDVRPHIWEAAVRSEHVGHGLRGVFSSQVFIDLEPTDDIVTPSYASGRTPLQTLSRLELEPETLDSLSLGALRLDRLLLDIGAFEDRSNPINRSAALTATVTSGRVRESHAISLDRQPLWRGATLSGRMDFSGYYYGTQERQVEWLNRIEGRQAFGDVGSLSLTFTRDVREGETPFRFDVITYRSRTDLLHSLSFAPLPWLRFDQSGGYVFSDTRNPGDVGWVPLQSTLTLLSNLNWVTLTVRNTYDIAESDPGTIDANLDLRAGRAGRDARFSASLTVRHIEDLAVLPDRITMVPVDDSATHLDASVGYRDLVQLSVDTAYRYAPPTPPVGQPPDHWDDLSVSLTLGTLRQEDALPGLAVTYARDLDLGVTSQFGVEATTRLGPLRVAALERLSLPSGQIAQSRLRVEWPGAVAAEATGLEWLPPGWLGLPIAGPYARQLGYTLEAAPEFDQPTWQVQFSTTYDPVILAGAGGYKGSALTGRALLDNRVVGPAEFSVDGFVEFQWRDHLQPETYLRRANLTLGVDLYQRVGLQGTFGYAASYDLSALEVSSARLTLSEVALVVRALDSLYLGAVVTDVWDLTGNDPGRQFQLRPKFTVVWNRCCWALYGSWDSATGAVSITLTTPGADQGLGQVFDTGWIIPRRQP
ncbi:MAG TPA: hypothetical protein VFN03_13580 [Trueperaceae bacterium]|nr:hypothetical protein [Trueperaceae bacterium]